MSEPSETRRCAVSVAAVRVRYAETDRMGVAWHGHYLAWYEVGRTELMRELGCPYDALEDREGIFFPVIEVGCRYRLRARYDERLAVHTRLVHVGGARVRFGYELRRQGDGELLATGFSEHAAVGPEGRPRRMPEALRRRLSAGASEEKDLD